MTQLIASETNRSWALFAKYGGGCITPVHLGNFTDALSAHAAKEECEKNESSMKYQELIVAPPGQVPDFW